MSSSLSKRAMGHGAVLRVGALAAILACGQAGASTHSYLQSLLAATPAGGWVKANTNQFTSAWAIPGQGGLTDQGHANPGSVVAAWSGFAWDSTSHDLLLWGGGHATYRGNEKIGRAHV